MHGILAAAGYVPARRLERAEIGALLGSSGGSGTRAVAGPDEDTTTMGVEAARLALAGTEVEPTQLWFATAAPAYLDKTNATAVHAALRLDPSVLAIDTGGATRSGVGALRAALSSSQPTLVVSADLCSGPPTSASESSGGDGAAALLVGTDEHGPLVGRYLGGASVTDEFLERWRTPGDRHTRRWEERFAESVYPDLARQAWKAALSAAEVEADDVARIVACGTHARSVAKLDRTLGVEDVSDDLTATVGAPGTAQAGLSLTAALEAADAGEVVALVSLVDGSDVLLFEASDASTSSRTVAHQVESAFAVDYGTFLRWRGELVPEAPNRPPPDRVSAPAAHRNRDWKFGFSPLADRQGTIVTFTVDRLAWSLSPPVVFAVVDFDGAGDGPGDRFPLELTDVVADEVAIGDRVEATFRRLTTADGIHNYFWKGRPIR